MGPPRDDDDGGGDLGRLASWVSGLSTVPEGTKEAAMKTRLFGGVVVAAAGAVLLGLVISMGAINCDIFWFTIECWFASV